MKNNGEINSCVYFCSLWRASRRSMNSEIYVKQENLFLFLLISREWFKRNFYDRDLRLNFDLFSMLFCWRDMLSRRVEKKSSNLINHFLFMKKVLVSVVYLFIKIPTHSVDRKKVKRKFSFLAKQHFLYSNISACVVSIYF